MRKGLQQHQPAKPEQAMAKQALEPLAEGINHHQKRPREFFSKMENPELIDFARQSILGRRIGCKEEMKKAEPGLYTVLRVRGLIDRVFAPIDHSIHKEAVQGVLESLESFGDEE